MASSLDIDPAKGHGIVTAQNIPGGYDAIDDRRQWGVGRQEGATAPLAYKVTQRSEGANLSVDVACNEGHFLVQGDDEDWQDLYLIPATALKANLDLEDPPDITNPRVDQVVLEAHDDVYYGADGSTRGRVYVLTGIPTAGADVVDSAEYESSKAPLPDSTARLAEFIVDADAESIVDADIRDRRAWASGAYSYINLTSGGPFSRTSATPVEMTSDLRVRLECSGRPLRMSLILPHTAAASGTFGGRVVAWVDGETVDGYNGDMRGADIDSLHVSREVEPSAGSHEFTWAFQGNGSAAFTVQCGAGYHIQAIVEEILRPNASNG